MGTRVPVYVRAADPISQAGLASQLRFQPEVTVVEQWNEDAAPPVAVVAAEVADEQTLRLLRQLNHRGCPAIVLVISTMDDSGLLSALETGVCAVVSRAEATPTRLARLAVQASSGEFSLPQDMLGKLIKQVSRLQHHVLTPMGLNMSGLSLREVNVLKLVAEGFGTHDIAQELSYSERTVKNILHDVTSRLQLRNRSHAVAYAIREGLI
jgi:DNA-binding NarL/FixJ family response regulator